MEDNAAADAAARELRVDFARTSRGLTTGQDDESPPTSLVSEVSARSRRSTALVRVQCKTRRVGERGLMGLRGAGGEFVKAVRVCPLLSASHA